MFYTGLLAKRCTAKLQTLAESQTPPDAHVIAYQSKMQVKQFDASTGMLTLAYEYTKANVDLWYAVFEAQRYDPDQAAMLLNATYTRFIHVNLVDGGSQLGYDYDLGEMSVRQYIHHEAAFSNTYTDTPTATQPSTESCTRPNSLELITSPSNWIPPTSGSLE